MLDNHNIQFCGCSGGSGGGGKLHTDAPVKRPANGGKK